jgi:hypothetical protein
MHKINMAGYACPKEPMKPNLLFAIAAFCLFLAPACAQEVIMTQPSADTAPKGRVFVRGDNFYTQAPSFYQENLNLAVGGPAISS